ncbi:MAG TPA: tetratricopeptide repeat protein [Burkholderiales bacterium]|nr:tetratricopeptide repeat protein [Burkholderiales bacterium]
MSLLLEALKKAEKAKEDAQRRASEGGSELQLADTAQAPAGTETPVQPVVTRAELPDITAPLEILPEDIATGSASTGAAGALSLESAPQPRASGAAPRRPAADSQPAQRATARKVFEAKVREPNPRLPFLITMGALGVFIVGTVIYFWIQLRPPAPLVNTNPRPPTGEVAAPAAPSAPTTPSTQSQSASAAAAIPGLPSSTPPAPSSTPAASKPAPRATPPAPPRSATPAVPRDTPAPRIAAVTRAPVARAPAPRSTEVPVPPASQPVPRIHPRVAAGYAAYQEGKLEAARNEYQLALREEPGNRDALLGLAALDMREQRYESADALYRQVLRTDPRDAYAHAGLLALRGQGIDPVTTESRLKTLLAAEPESAVLNFALGNQYAQQARWAEAQQAYFKAVAAEPENPDYAYNLAVSLEHLRQAGPARDYYRRALALAEGRNASFDRAAAQARVQQLAR